MDPIDLQITLREQLTLSGVSKTAYYYDPVPEDSAGIAVFTSSKSEFFFRHKRLIHEKFFLPTTLQRVEIAFYKLLYLDN